MFVTVSQAAKMLGVSVARVHQFINEPCRVCGKVEYDKSADGWTFITYKYGDGCEACRHTGRRLPVHGRFGKEHKHGYMLDTEDLDRLKDRVPGYPKGKKRTRKPTT